MMGDPEHVLTRLEDRAPGAVELAVLTSTAVGLEPELLRDIRLTLAPQLAADAEADLWVSEIVDARDPTMITVIPAVGELLRSRLRALLAADTHLESRLHDVLRRCHGDLPVSLALEEEIRWVSVTAPEAEVADRLEPLLARALAGVVDHERAGLARWAGRAFRRLPESSRATPSSRSLAQLLVARGTLPVTELALMPEVVDGLALEHVAGVSDELGSTRLGIRRTGDLLELGDVGSGGSSISLPASNPRVVEVDGEVVHVARDGTVKRPVGWARTDIVTARGDVFNVEAEPESASRILDGVCVVVEHPEPRVGILVGGGLVVTVTHPGRPTAVRHGASGALASEVTVEHQTSELTLLHVSGLPDVAIEVHDADPSDTDGVWHGRGISPDGRLVPIAGRVPDPWVDAGVLVRYPTGTAISGSPVMRGGAITGVVRGSFAGHADEEWVSVAPPSDVRELLGRAQLVVETSEIVTPTTDFATRVRIARGELTPTSGTVNASQTVHFDPQRPISVQVVARENADVLDSDSRLFGLPSGDWASELTFRAKAIEPGPVVVQVVLRQGPVPVATVRLETTAAAGGTRAPTPETALARPGVDAPELAGVSSLYIGQERRSTGELVYRYAVRLVPDDARFFESTPIVGHDDFLGRWIAEVERVGMDPDQTKGAQLRRLQDIGTMLFEAYFPVDMQAYLWRHRDRLYDLLVYTDETHVPWELVHLKPPDGKRGQSPRFLGQDGLVRWHVRSFPPRQLRVRKGRARTICPVYANPMFRTTSGPLEAAYLRERFGAKAVRATPIDVKRLLRKGGFDLLHFSGYAGQGKLLLNGVRSGNTVTEQYLTAADVAQNLDWTSPDGIGPLVVLNDCQTGRSGELFTTVGDFAKAFLEAGASAFVSCLWSVQEEPARVFVETLYEELLKGTPMSRASALARAAAREAGDPTWLSYLVYARPDAVLSFG